MKIPCEECLLIPICRYKGFRTLIFQCDKLHDLLYGGNSIDVRYRTPKFVTKIIKVVSTLKPTRWHLANQGNGHVIAIINS